MCVARDSTLWVGTDHGGVVSVRDGVVSGHKLADSISAYATRLLMERNDHSVWVAFPGAGLWSQDIAGRADDVWQRVTSPSRRLNSVWAAFEDSDSSLWLGENGALVHMTGRSAVWYGAGLGIPKKQIISILRDARGTLLIGTMQGGLYMLRQGRATRVPGATILSHAIITSLCKDPGGGVWIGTADMGLLFYDGKAVTPCMSSSKSSPLQIGCIMPDNQGNLRSGPTVTASIGSAECRALPEGR